MSAPASMACCNSARLSTSISTGVLGAEALAALTAAPILPLPIYDFLLTEMRRRAGSVITAAATLNGVFLREPQSGNGFSRI